MITLQNSNFLGIHSLKEVTNIEFGKRMTILTGLNGSGKSTILLGIFLALDGLSERKNRNILTPRKNWGIELILIDDNADFKKFHGTFNNIIPKSNIYIKFRNIILEKQDFNTIQKVSEKTATSLNDEFSHSFNSVLSMCNANINKKTLDKSTAEYSFGLSDRSEDNTEVFSFQVGSEMKSTNDFINGYGDDLRINNDKFSAVLYQDEQFFHTKNTNGFSDVNGIDIFSKNNNLDKSIYLLLMEFRKKIIASKSKLPEILSDNIMKNREFFNKNSKESLRLYLEELINEEKYNDDVNDFINKINIFFGELKKKAYISDSGDIYFKEFLGIEKKEKTVKWYDCSKGEKNLLSLLLMVFIYKDTNTFFIFDEPDLALHINWQKKLLKVFSEIAPNSQFIISTHSPALIPQETSDIKFVNISKLKEEVEARNE